MSLPSGFVRTPPQVLNTASHVTKLIRPVPLPTASSSTGSSVIASARLAHSKAAKPPTTVHIAPTPLSSHHDLSPTWFNSAGARFGGNGGKGDDDRRIKLGRSTSSAMKPAILILQGCYRWSTNNASQLCGFSTNGCPRFCSRPSRKRSSPPISPSIYFPRRTRTCRRFPEELVT